MKKQYIKPTAELIELDYESIAIGYDQSVGATESAYSKTNNQDFEYDEDPWD